MAADAEGTVALSIGSQRISMGVFEPAKGGGLILKSYGSTSILADPAQEVARLPQITLAIKELATGLKIGKEKVRYSMSGQSVFTRFVKLPALDEDNIDQLVAFEAQQHVPFPIDEVTWDWELLPESGPEKEVALVAIKGDALAEINETVAEAGLGTKEVDAAPMALYNAFRFNYPDVQEPVLLMDIGAKATNLVYIEGDRVFTRSIAVGAASITTAIAKEYNISFAEAESQKIANGMVSLGGGHTGQLDEATAQLATVIRNALNRLPAEVARTNNFYRSQQDGNPPTKVYLAGGGANLPYLPEFLEEKLRLPIELFNPLQRVSVGKAIDVEQLQHESHMIGELVGLALRGIGKATVSIDLVPSVVASERATAKRKPFLTASAVILIAGMGLWTAGKFINAGKASGLRQDAESEVGALQPIASDIDKHAANQSRLEALGAKYAAAQELRTQWVEIVNKTKDYFASTDVWITDFEPVTGYQVGEFDTATTLIREGFATASYGTPAFEPPRASSGEEETRRPARRGSTPTPSGINAIRITGYWKDSPRAVTDVVDKIMADHDSADAIFNLTKAAERGSEAKPLTEGEIFPVKRTTIGNPNELAEKFVMILPLKNPIPIN